MPPSRPWVLEAAEESVQESNQLLQTGGQARSRIQQTGDRAQQIAQEITGSRLCGDVEYAWSR